MKIFDGDLLKSGCDIICHQTNCFGAMGAGIALQIKKQFPEVYSQYKQHCQKNDPAKLLGTIQSVRAGNLVVINCFSQYNYSSVRKQTDYNAVRLCMNAVKEFVLKKAKEFGRPVRVGFPDHYGCGLAGGDWSIVLPIIKEELDIDGINLEIWKYSI